MHALMVGGAGYIGSVIGSHLIDSGHQVTVVDDFSTGHRAAVPGGARCIAGDLHGDALEEALGGAEIDLVVHLAARSLVPESMCEPGLYFETAVGGIVHLLDGMRRHGVRRLLFSSTASVYGFPDVVPIDEQTVCAPVNPYGESKHMVERILHWYGEVHDVEWMALRYFNAAGAAYDRGEDHDPETHLIPIALGVAAIGQTELVIHGNDYPTSDGTCVRDYIHVMDLAVAHRLAGERLVERGAGGDRIFNLGGGRGHSVLEVVETVRQVTGAPVSARIGPRRAGDPAVLVAAAMRAREELGWVPSLDLEAMVATAWEWRGQHPSGYDS